LLNGNKKTPHGESSPQGAAKERRRRLRDADEDIIHYYLVHVKQEEKMAGSSATSSGGIGFAGLLTIVFIVLKLLGKISWSWWWVLSPIWISALAGVIVLLIVVIIATMS